MARRSYEQYCALAKALDIVGERWTLLILRELFAGPQRFSDLLQTLPGIGNGLLATRLREMQENGLIEIHELPPPAPARVYRLTTRGRQLDSAVTALGRWGAELLGPPATETHQHPLWLLQSLAARTKAEATHPSAANRTYIDMQIDGQTHHLRLQHNRVIAGRNTHPQAQACVIATSEILYALSRRVVRLEDAVSEGQLEIDGDREVALRVLQALFSEQTSANVERE